MTASVLTASVPYLQKRPTNVRDGEDSTSASLDSGRVQASRRDEDEVDCTDYNSHDGCDSSLTRKRRKKDQFQCSYESCEKVYSKREHLKRHQLNHYCEQVYTCDFPDCNRSFVREDLYVRHKERHPALSLGLLHMNTFNEHDLNSVKTDSSPSKLSSIKTQELNDVQYLPPGASIVGSSHQMSPLTLQPPGSITTISEQDSLRKRRSDDTYGSNSEAEPHDVQSQNSGNFALLLRAADPSNYGTGCTFLQNPPHVGVRNLTWLYPYAPTPNNSPYGLSSPSSFAVTPLQCGYSTSQIGTQNNADACRPQIFSSSTSPSIPGYDQGVGNPVLRERATQIYNDTSGSAPMNGVESTHQIDRRLQGTPGAMVNRTPAYAMPTFGAAEHNQSPFAVADDFEAWLLKDNQSSLGGALPMHYPSGVCPVADAWRQTGSQELSSDYIHLSTSYLNNPTGPAYPMAAQTILDTTLPETALLEDKRKDLLNLIHLHFNETGHAPVMAQKEAIMKGDKDDSRHVLSLCMMQSYISSYWKHVHPQLPILHKPTFDASTCPELLLLAMMCLGASSLEKNYDQETTQSCAQLADFLAWHLRWALLMDPNARPPAKLWATQSLLLLEVFEKMYSTRLLHERAHVYHATTWTLLRRGNSLTGRSATDSHPSVKEESSRGTSGTDSPDEWWSLWITKEATTRATFAAFVMDIMHATVFGHSAVMATHEMRLPLPCDEALWSARSNSEVRQAMQSDYVHPISFLDGLKKTFNKEAIKTSPFGRMILMAGLLSVSWHVNQWDLQTSSLGMTAALDRQDERLASLTYALDFWRQKDCPAPDRHGCRDGTGDDDISESQAVLYHLANMATHVNFVDCQIYAGASEVLGKSITLQDFKDAKRRMEEWAPTARARHATFHAFCLLSRVMVRRGRSPSPSNPFSDISSYSARDDHIPYRSWALCLATLVVWSYGFALEGPVQTPYQLLSYERKVEDMVVYLNRMGGAKTPEDLSKTSHCNACWGLLIIMQDIFKQTRWELLREAGRSLTKCIEMLLPHTASG